jgi:MFS family permease
MDLKQKQRIALSAAFFQSGLCFSSWASRIPDIKEAFNLDDHTLGLLLLIKPLGSFIGLPLAGLFVDRYGSRMAVMIAIFSYSICLILIAFCPTVYWLAGTLFLFGMCGNLANVSLNTQGLAIQKSYGRVVMASFHGLWSAAGFTGAAFGALAISFHVEVLAHFIAAAAVILILLMLSFPFLHPGKSDHVGTGFAFKLPEKPLVKLGIIAFCGMMCEGCMFDWSGVYFKEVIGAEKGLIGAGFISFMAMMATGRFVSDAITNRAGSHAVLQASGILIFCGLLLSVVFPYFIAGIAGFFLVGLGTSSVIPLTYSEVGKTPHSASPGRAIAMVSTIGYCGFVLGPPFIGFISEALSLRVSFTLIAVAGLSITWIAAYNKARKQTVEEI